MDKDVSVESGGGRSRTRVMGALAAVLVAAAFVPLTAASGHGRHHGHQGSRGDSKLLFYASDGMRQDQVAKYADQGRLPGFRDMLRHGAFASRNGLLTQARRTPARAGSR
jgi:hypothetical protein